MPPPRLMFRNEQTVLYLGEVNLASSSKMEYIMGHIVHSMYEQLNFHLVDWRRCCLIILCIICNQTADPLTWSINL